jgi:hypothetical protein
MLLLLIASLFADWRYGGFASDPARSRPVESARAQGQGMPAVVAPEPDVVAPPARLVPPPPPAAPPEADKPPRAEPRRPPVPKRAPRKARTIRVEASEEGIPVSPLISINCKST